MNQFLVSSLSYAAVIGALIFCCTGCGGSKTTSPVIQKSYGPSPTVFCLVQSPEQRKLADQLIEMIDKHVPPEAVKVTFIQVEKDGLIRRRTDDSENRILAQICRELDSKDFGVSMTPQFAVCDKDGTVRMERGTLAQVTALCTDLTRPEPAQQVAQKTETAQQTSAKTAIKRKVSRKLLIDPMKKLMTFKAPYNEGVSNIAVSPDSKQIALLHRNGHLQIVDLHGRVTTDGGYPGVKGKDPNSDVHIATPPPYNAAQFQFSPAGSRLAYRLKSTILVCDSKTGKLLNLWDLETKESSFFWLSETSLLVNPLKQLNVASKEGETIPTFAEAIEGPVEAVSPDQSLIACACRYDGQFHRQVQIIEVASGKEVHRIDVPANPEADELKRTKRPLPDQFLGFDYANRAVFSRWSAGSQELYTIDVLHGGARGSTVTTFPAEYRGRNGRQFYLAPTLAVMRFDDANGIKTMRLYAGKDGKSIWSHTLPYRPQGGDFMGTVPTHFYLGDFCWFPDGSHFAFAGSQGSVHDLWLGDTPLALTE